MMTREEYLTTAVEKFRPLFSKNNLEIPPVKVSCGFSSKTPLKSLGECWSATCTPDGTRQIFVSPMHKDGVNSLGSLAHELVHACLPDDTKHGPKFKKAMKLVGLEGSARATEPGNELLLLIEKIVEELGNYPNPTLKPKEKNKREKAQSKKSFKLFCPKKRAGDKKCILTGKSTGDYTVTASRKSLELGFPLCPCSTEMKMESEDFELYKLGE